MKRVRTFPTRSSGLNSWMEFRFLKAERAEDGAQWVKGLPSILEAETTQGSINLQPRTPEAEVGGSAIQGHLVTQSNLE